MKNILLWYAAIVWGGFMILAKATGISAREVRCIVAGDKKNREFPLIHPLVLIPALTGTIVFGIVQCALLAVFSLPALIAAHVLPASVSRFFLRSKTSKIEPQATAKNHRHYYDGIMYRIAVESLNADMRENIARYTSAASTVIDSGCGTGGLALHLARTCRRVTGIDHARAMINFANSQAKKSGMDNVSFAHADATNLSSYKDNAFDYATIALVIHEMPHKLQIAVLKEASRVAKEVVIADYAAPMPLNAYGSISRCFEIMAGLSHLGAFLEYSRSGGLNPLLAQSGLAIANESAMFDDTMRIVKAAKEQP